MENQPQQIQQPESVNSATPNNSNNPGGYMSPQPNTPMQSAASTVKKSKKKLFIIIAVVVVVLAGIGGIGIKFALDVTAAPVKVSNQYVSDLQVGNYSSAANLESSAMISASSSQAQINSTWQAEDIPNTTTYKVVGKMVEKTNGKEYAAVVYEFASIGTAGYLKVELANTSSGWQILNFSNTHSTTPTIQ